MQRIKEFKYDAQLEQKHHFIAKEFIRKINKYIYIYLYSSILDRFQIEVFHARQLQHNWTKECCEYLDYIRTIDIFAQSLSRIIGTIRYVVSFSVRPETNGERTHKKPSRLPLNYTNHR